MTDGAECPSSDEMCPSPFIWTSVRASAAMHAGPSTCANRSGSHACAASRCVKFGTSSICKPRSDARAWPRRVIVCRTRTARSTPGQLLQTGQPQEPIPFTRFTAPALAFECRAGQTQPVVDIQGQHIQVGQNVPAGLCIDIYPGRGGRRGLLRRTPAGRPGAEARRRHCLSRDVLRAVRDGAGAFWRSPRFFGLAAARHPIETVAPRRVRRLGPYRTKPVRTAEVRCQLDAAALRYQPLRPRDCQCPPNVLRAVVSRSASTSRRVSTSSPAACCASRARSCPRWL